MSERTVLVLGPGGCGVGKTAAWLAGRPGCGRGGGPETLAWAGEADRLRRRLDRDRDGPAAVAVDPCPPALPYLADVLTNRPEVVALILGRPAPEAAAALLAEQDAYCPLPVNHFSADPADTGARCPVYSRCYPSFGVRDRRAGAELYVRRYAELAADLARRFPSRVTLADGAELANSAAERRRALAALGLDPGAAGSDFAFDPRDPPRPPARRPPAPAASDDPLDPARCVVLVPYNTQIVPHCEEGLRALRDRGYVVRRVAGFAAIDQGRNQIATDALLDGFAETMWVDADVGFDPAAVDALRKHAQPLVGGIYPQKGRRTLATHLLPGTGAVTFGAGGGLTEVLYSATGFLHVRREVYAATRDALALPVCNERFGKPTVPWFQPAVIPSGAGDWYLAEDYAFCDRAKRAGFRVWADTSLRLWHYGSYGYGWEDAGRAPERFEDFTLNLAGDRRPGPGRPGPGRPGPGRPGPGR